MEKVVWSPSLEKIQEESEVVKWQLPSNLDTQTSASNLRSELLGKYCNSELSALQQGSSPRPSLKIVEKQPKRKRVEENEVKRKQKVKSPVQKAQKQAEVSENHTVQLLTSLPPKVSEVPRLKPQSQDPFSTSEQSSMIQVIKKLLQRVVIQ